MLKLRFTRRSEQDWVGDDHVMVCGIPKLEVQRKDWLMMIINFITRMIMMNSQSGNQWLKIWFNHGMGKGIFWHLVSLFSMFMNVNVIQHMNTWLHTWISNARKLINFVVLLLLIISSVIFKKKVETLPTLAQSSQWEHETILIKRWTNKMPSALLFSTSGETTCFLQIVYLISTREMYLDKQITLEANIDWNLYSGCWKNVGSSCLPLVTRESKSWTAVHISPVLAVVVL